MKQYCVFATLMAFPLFISGQVLNCETTMDYGNLADHGHYAAVNGIRMYYETYGDPASQPLLLIHGNGGSVKAGGCQIESFQDAYYVVVADSRYQGKSDNGSAELTYRLMADDYAQLLNHLGLDSVLIIGQSDGGIIGLLLAIAYPALVQKLVAAAPNLRPDSTGLYQWSIDEMQADLQHVKTKMEAGDTSSALLREKVLIEKMLNYPHIEITELRSIQAPVLLIFGDSDYIPFTHIVEMYQNVPRANLLIVPGAGHRSYRLEPEIFNTFCKRFFEHPFQSPKAKDGY